MAKSEKTEVGTIGKVDLVRMASKKTQMRLSFDVVNDAYAAICESINECLMNGNTVIIQGIGRFQPIIRPGGEGRNPNTGETVQYEDRLALKFQTNTNLKLAMREVDLKSLGTWSNSKQVDEVGSEDSPRRGRSSQGLGKVVAGKEHRAVRGESATASNSSRRR